MCGSEFEHVLLALCDRIVDGKMDAVNAKIDAAEEEISILREALKDISNAKKIAELEEENERLRGNRGDLELALLKAQVEKEGR